MDNGRYIPYLLESTLFSGLDERALLVVAEAALRSEPRAARQRRGGLLPPGGPGPGGLPFFSRGGRQSRVERRLAHALLRLARQVGRQTDRGLLIDFDPDECIDCGACEPECPVGAIFLEEDVPVAWQRFIASNSGAFRRETTH